MEKVKILVVDDESRMRKLVRDFLTRQNYEVLEAADGEEALDIFYKDKEIALLILDVMMPKMNGWEVCLPLMMSRMSSSLMLLNFSTCRRIFSTFSSKAAISSSSPSTRITLSRATMRSFG